MGQLRAACNLEHRIEATMHGGPKPSAAVATAMESGSMLFELRAVKHVSAYALVCGTCGVERDPAKVAPEGNGV